MADRSSLSFRQTVSSAVFVIVAILAAETNGQCNGTTKLLTAKYSTYILLKPYYSDLYSSNADCSWLLKTTMPYETISISISSQHFGYQCNVARLEIFDGDWVTSPRLARLCGSNSYQTVNSSGPSALIFFTSNGVLDTFYFNYNAQSPWDSLTTTTSLPWWRIMTTAPTTTTTTPNPACVPGSHTSLYAWTSTSYLWSPNYYHTNLLYSNCRWKISCFYCTLALTVNNLYTGYSNDCTNNYLDIYDGDSSTSPLLVRLCGSIAYQTYNSSGSSLFLSFSGSDGRFGSYGFFVTYTATTTTMPWWIMGTTSLPWWMTTTTTVTRTTTLSTCIKRDFGGVTLNAEYLNEKYIEWPNYLYYDNFYLNNADCAWRLLAEMDYVIHVRVIKMDLEYHEACAYDSVTLYDASWELNSSKIAKLCKYSSSALDYYSSGINMFITFTSDSTNTNTGFRLMYESVRPSDVPASSTSSNISVVIGAIIGVIAGIVIIAVICVLIIKCNRKSRRACRSQAARRPRAAYLTERTLAPPPYTTVSSQFVCGGIVLGSRNGPPAIGARPHSGYSNPGYADTEGHGPPPAYSDLVILGHILPPAGRQNDNSDSVPAVPSAPLYTVSPEARGEAGGSDTATLDPKNLSLPAPPSYDDVIRVTGASPPPRPLPPLPLTATAITVSVVQSLAQ